MHEKYTMAKSTIMFSLMDAVYLKDETALLQWNDVKYSEIKRYKRK